MQKFIIVDLMQRVRKILWNELQSLKTGRLHGSSRVYHYRCRSLGRNVNRASLRTKRGNYRYESLINFHKHNAEKTTSVTHATYLLFLFFATTHDADTSFCNSLLSFSLFSIKVHFYFRKSPLDVCSFTSVCLVLSYQYKLVFVWGNVTRVI